MPNQTPEQEARDRIDEKLYKAGWHIQNKNEINFNAGLGIAIREYQTEVGPVDYALFINRAPVGVIEAKREEEGQRLSLVEEQSGEYAASKLKYFNNELLPFVYESTGLITRFTDNRDPKPRASLVFYFHRPETFQEWLKQEESLRRRFFNLPELETAALRDCQIRAIRNLEGSFKQNRTRALVQMATGSGKTFTAISVIYRLLKFVKAKRVLFLVDTKNLGEQAEQEFMAYTPSDDNRKFTELYTVQRLTSPYVATDSQVCISTIQRLYSILKDEELSEEAEETDPNRIVQPKEPVPVGYNPKIPIEFFDFIIIDECHRSIYNLWKQVLDYFDSFLIGLTATPDKRTFGFFNENVVSEYTHEEAVTDGVNVGYDVFTIETETTKNGDQIVAKEFVDKRDKLTRRKRWEQLDEDLTYSSRDLDKGVVNPSQIRNIIRAFKEKLPEIFPQREEVPKTLIFAKSDSHAEDIIEIVREEFNEGNDFCKKVTYQSKEDPKSVLSQFRNAYNPRIAVTVDMIATGTDVKPLECLLFMRDVKSRNYFEQMKGRGTRTLGYDDLKKVTASAQSDKTHFVIVDAVGVTKSLKTDSRPLERKRTVPLKNLMEGVMMRAQDEDAMTSLASRLTRLNKQMSTEERERVTDITGVPTGEIAKSLLRSYDPDAIITRAQQDYQLPPDVSPTPEQEASAQQALLTETANLFTGELIEYLDNVRKVHEQIIDTVNLDRVTFAGWDEQAKEQAENLVQDFKTFIEEHKDEITALNIFYNLPYQQRSITASLIREVLDILKTEKPYLAPLNVWRAYQQVEQVKTNDPINELTALVGLIRRVAGLDEELTTYATTVNRNFQRWVFQKQRGAAPKFNEEQMEWLRMIKDHVASSFSMEQEDLDYAPFDSKGGIGKMYKLFGDDIDSVIEELNQELVA